MNNIRQSGPKTLATLALASAISMAGISGAQADELPYGLKSGKPYAGTKLTYLAPVAGQYSGHEERIQEFTDMTGIEVEFEFVPFKNLFEKVLSVKVGGDAEPDLINYLDSWGPGLKDMFAPLDPMLASDGISMDRYHNAHALGATYDGTVYGLPLRGHAQLLFYRKDLLEKHNLAAPTSWADLVKAAKVIKEKEGIGMGLYFNPKGAQPVSVWTNILWSNGGDLFKDGKVIFNSPEGVEALRFFADLELKEKVTSEGAKSFDQYDASLSMGAGKSAFYLGWWWHYGSRILGKNTTLTADQVGFTSMPSFKGGDAATFAISMPTAINTESNKQEAAWEFLKWVSNPDLEKVNVIDKSKRNVIVAVHKTNLLDADVNAANQGLQQMAAGSLQNSRIFPQLPVWQEVMQIIANSISEVVSDGKDPKVALDEAAVKAQKLIDRDN